MSHYNTATGSHEAPAPSPFNQQSAPGWRETPIDTKVEAEQYRARIERLAAEIADPSTSPQRRDMASVQKASMERALPLQLKVWAEIDARRAAKGSR